MRICTAQEMRELERDVIERVGVPGLSLMEVAGRGVVELCVKLGRQRTVVLCGPGNNGGDGFVVARLLHGLDWPVRALALFDSKSARAVGDGAAMRAAAERAGVVVEETLDVASFDAALTRSQPELIVDALLGTGLARAVEGLMAHAIAAVNEHAALKVAVDLPSGLSADRGVPLGSAVRAHHTVTFALPKIGLCSSPGFLNVGQLHVVDIGIPRAAVERLPSLLIDESVLAPVRHESPRDHKGTRGHVLVYAGSSGKCGAALLCATSAQRSGAGLVTMLAASDLRAALEGRTLALMQHFFDTPPSDAECQKLLDGKRALAVGPGLDGDDKSATPALVRRILSHAHALKIRQAIDAEALNLVARDASILPASSDGDLDRVLLPHPGEAARLLGGGATSADVESDRIVVARRLAERYQAVVALKGARTIVAAPDGRLAICPMGGPALGTGGSGDVLCGVVAALLARTPRMDTFDAACTAVYWHGRAGDLLATRQPVFISDDLPAALADALL